MAIEFWIGIAFLAVFALSLVDKLIPKARPKENYFKCARCGTRTPHSERTIEAWRNKKTKFFCNTCHRKWLEKQPPKVRQEYSSLGHPATSGCLGVVLLLLAIPTVLGYVWLRFYA